MAITVHDDADGDGWGDASTPGWSSCVAAGFVQTGDGHASDAAVPAGGRATGCPTYRSATTS